MREKEREGEGGGRGEEREGEGEGRGGGGERGSCFFIYFLEVTGVNIGHCH